MPIRNMYSLSIPIMLTPSELKTLYMTSTSLGLPVHYYTTIQYTTNLNIVTDVECKFRQPTACRQPVNLQTQYTT